MDPLLARHLVRFHPVGEDHVVDALEGVPRRLGILDNHVEVFLERSLPVFLAKLSEVLSL